ncbi:hypothetical protein BTJ68_03626 [Hortaea werneckii EXF-2000]|uniref:RNA recognition motif-containing protein n=1 Tax=Hortaea werneckii EXF-2000 TaxID=1157616 RepID=A0A1Z5TKK7_HORWE|nr:hypothetical protein BTJ68_03626 [Hortaea werneckii EXF-2000]
MPAVPGESLLTTLFADVHYYFSDPASKPPHHRFDRGSYVYVYQNASAQTAKLEIANHAGTPDQDAFSGNLDVARVHHSHKQPTLFTFNIQGAMVQDRSQWHLPAHDSRGEQKYLYKIHALDVYLWTESDAASFLQNLRATIPSPHLTVKDAPAPSANTSKARSPAEHRDSMSPVVQQLEKTAVGSNFPPRAESTISAHSLPGPPTPATSAGATTSSAAPEPIAHREKTPPPPEEGAPQQQFASMPHGYQPGGPQVPTPQHGSFFSSTSSQQQPMGFAGPPRNTPPGFQQGRSFSGGLPPPPPPPGAAPSPYQTQQAGYPPSFPSGSEFPPTIFLWHAAHQTQQQPTQQYATYPQSSGFGPSIGSPAGMPGTPGQHPQHQHQQTQFNNMYPGHQQQHHQQPPTPSAPPAYANHTPLQSPGLPPPPTSQPPGVATLGNYPQYTAGYSSPPQQQQQAAGGSAPYPQDQTSAYQQHQALYRPTEAETAFGQSTHGYGVHPSSSSSTAVTTAGGESGSAGGKRGSGANAAAAGGGNLEGRMEKRVGGFLKRLDRLI